MSLNPNTLTELKGNKTNDPLQILVGDAAVELPKLPEASVELVVTSPPYDSLRTYGGLEWDFEIIASELYRVLTPGGVLCWNVNDSTIDGSETLTSCKQKIFFREQCGFVIHDTMIYGKKNFSAADSSRYHQLFEYVFILSKGAPRTFNPICDKRNVCAGQTTFGANGKRQPDGSFQKRRQKVYGEFGKRGNIWIGNTRGQENPCAPCPHPAMMPKWLARDLILSFSNPGHTVLDPMAGSGTTGKEAIQLGRKTILIERNTEYIPLLEGEVHLGLQLP